MRDIMTKNCPKDSYHVSCNVQSVYLVFFFSSAVEEGGGVDGATSLLDVQAKENGGQDYCGHDAAPDEPDRIVVDQERVAKQPDGDGAQNQASQEFCSTEMSEGVFEEREGALLQRQLP